jgi:hypothetical protein
MEKPVDYSALEEAIERAMESDSERDAVDDLREAVEAKVPFPRPGPTVIESDDDTVLLRALIAEGRSLQRELAVVMTDIAKENEARRQRSARRMPGAVTRESR